MKQIKNEIIQAIQFKNANPNTSNMEVCRKFNIDKATLRKYLDMDVDKYFKSDTLNCYISFDEKERLAVNEYLTTDISFEGIKRKYGYKNERMKAKLYALGEDVSRKYKVNFNRNAFDRIENESDAYILGFILADGYINENRNALTIKLNAKDVDILKKINGYLECENEIKTAVHNITHNEEKYICFNSCTLIDNLKKYGLYQGKSLKEIPYKDMDKSLIRHYIRGIFDGDGYVAKGKFATGVCGSKETLEFIHEHLKNELDLETTTNVVQDKECSIYRLNYGKKNDVLKILNYLYGGSNIYLDRKYKLAMKKLNENHLAGAN